MDRIGSDRVGSGLGLIWGGEEGRYRTIMEGEGEGEGGKGRRG